eukprot:COSAG04_NODE_538_length_12896_cov_41.168243_12_plen_68_part_00
MEKKWPTLSRQSICISVKTWDSYASLEHVFPGVFRPFFDPFLVFFLGYFCISWKFRHKARKPPKNGE